LTSGLDGNQPSKDAGVNESEDSSKSTNTLCVAGWDVHTSRNLIVKGEQSVKLEPRTMAVLVRLTESPGEVISRQELEESVWPGMVVGYDALSNSIVKLRKAFGDDRRDPQILETIPKVGYRLIASVRSSSSDSESETATKRLERKLTAILYVDVAGYSRMTEADEEGTHELLSANLDRLTASIQSHSGRVIHYAGDAVLSDFPTVTEALTCAVEVQRSPDGKSGNKESVRFRIGVNLGEVIVDRDDIYGEGVNVAARLEALAEPGGICISEAVRSAVGNKLPLAYDFMGEQKVKNIAQLIRTYRVLLDPDAQPKLRRSRRLRWTVGISSALILVGGLAIWWTEARLGIAPIESSGMATQSKPAIAVLPFENLNSDPEQSYFSDGITNDIINDLSRFSNLTVIARNSVFTYKGKPTKVQTVARELGVRYVLEGSVQRADERVRINVQLAEARSGQQLWAKRFDEPVTSLFDLQDKITRRVVRTLSVRVTEIERRRVSSRTHANFNAYNLTLHGQALLSRLKRAENFEAREFFRQAIELDPGYAAAYAALGWTFLNTVLYGWGGSPSSELRRAEELARKATALDDASIEGHRLLARVLLMRRNHDLAVLELERAISLNPNDANSYADQGLIFVYSNRIDAAIRSLEVALRIDPNMTPEALMHLGMAYYLKGQYTNALPWLERGIARNPDNVFIHIVLAATFAQLRRETDAARSAASVLRLDPFFRTERYGSLFSDSASAAHIVDGLHKAGLK
jgi:TolB-like protein/class 3 adenylate cyclase